MKNNPCIDEETAAERNRWTIAFTAAVQRVFRAAGKWLAAFVLVSVTAGFGSCNGGGGDPPDYVLRGSVSGLLPGHSVLLQNFGSNTITVSENGNFQFSTPMAGGAPYSVSVLTQPSGELRTHQWQRHRHGGA